MSWLRGLAVVSLVAAGLLGSASSASAVTVADEVELRAAVANSAETTITLSADITLTCDGGGALARASATPLTIAGGHHWINQTCAGVDLIDVSGTGGLTLSDIALSGGESTVVSDDAPVTVGGTLILGGNQYAIDSATGPINVSGAFIFSGLVAGIHSSGAKITAADVGFSAGGAGIIADGELELERVSVSNAGTNGVVANGTTRIVNSTILYSRQNGIVAGGPVTLVYSTVAASAAFGEPGVNLAFGGPDGSYDVQNTVVSRQIYTFGMPAPSVSPANCAPGAITSSGYNAADDATCPFTSSTDLPQGVDPRIESTNVPGFSLFAALVPQAGSPLIGAIPGAACQAGGAAGVTTDEFGQPRPGGEGRCDIGAFQTQGVTTPPVPPDAVVTPPRFTG